MLGIQLKYYFDGVFFQKKEKKTRVKASQRWAFESMCATKRNLSNIRNILADVCFMM